MKNLSSWLIAIFAFMFWAFRVVSTLLNTMGTDFIAPPMDMTMEIVLLFITFICICLIYSLLLFISLHMECIMEFIYIKI